MNKAASISAITDGVICSEFGPCGSIRNVTVVSDETSKHINVLFLIVNNSEEIWYADHFAAPFALFSFRVPPEVGRVDSPVPSGEAGRAQN